MKVTFITVSWNGRELLDACLASVFQYTVGMPIEVIVIDNASSDGSAAMVEQKYPLVKLIKNEDNKGFGAGCNQGIAIARGEYIFLLNPDGRLRAGTTQELVDFMDEHPDVGACAPLIRNSDGSIQQSVRRFPTPLSQVFILFKLRRFSSRIPILRNYFALDFDYARDLQEIDQPMGAAMLIRRSVLDRVGGFDERFFLWFEEVDLCRRIKSAGWKIIYCARAEIVHQGGKSFARQSILERQKNFFRSCGQYLRKHCGTTGRIVGGGMQRFAWCMETVQIGTRLFSLVIPQENTDSKKGAWGYIHYSISKPLFFLTLITIVGIELCSYLGYLYSPITAIAFGFVVAGVFMLGLWRLDYGVAALFSELIIGSKGHLLSITLGNSVISLRIALFVVLFAAWCLREVRIIAGLQKAEKTLAELFRGSRLLRWYALLLGVVGIGILNSLVHGTSKGALFDDANAWLFFLISPCIYRAFATKESVCRSFSILISAFVAQTLKVLLAFYIMGHKGFGVDGLTTFYRWIRSTGIGEITQLSNIYRIFFQSQIYVVVLLCILTLILLYRLFYTYLQPTKISVFLFPLIKMRWITILSACTFASLLLSFSRSFWLGTFVIGCALAAAAVWRLHHRWQIIGVWVSAHFYVVCIALLLLFGISSIPVPSSQGAFALESLSDRVKDVQDEAAAASRWNLLPVLIKDISHHPFLGYGFGKTVTYISRDPRVLLSNPLGTYTTYAFEWGYLDILLKLGILGLLIYLCTLRELFFQGVRALEVSAAVPPSDLRAIVAGLMLGIGGLLIIHMFTPYLNHPLGIGLILFTGLVFERMCEDKMQDTAIRDNSRKI